MAASSSSGEAQDAILSAIKEIAEEGPLPPAMATAVRDLAEAWAWLAYPAQPHGGHADRDS